MSDLLDDLDHFVEMEEEDELTKIARQPVLPSQLAEITRGTWALTLGSIHGLMTGGGLTDMIIRVGYIFADQDWTAVAAIEGQEIADTERAEADARYDDNMRYGRWYDEDNPSGKRTFQNLGGLLPITEEQAREVMFCDFKLPIVATMCDWFRPAIERVIEELSSVKISGLATLKCPKCGNEDTGVRVSYEGQAVAQAMLRTNEDGTFAAYQMTEVKADYLGTITHAHHICPSPECDYDEHLDLSEVEVLVPGQIFTPIEDL